MTAVPLTPYQQLALVRDIVGTVPRIQPYDELVKLVIEDDKVGLTVRRFTVTERATETLLTSARLVTQVWTRDPATDLWSPVVITVDGKLSTQFVLDDDSFKPLIISHRGGKTVDEYRDMLYWDALCARPGAGRLNQRDYDQHQADTAKRWNKVFGKGSYENA